MLDWIMIVSLVRLRKKLVGVFGNRQVELGVVARCFGPYQLLFVFLVHFGSFAFIGHLIRAASLRQIQPAWPELVVVTVFIDLLETLLWREDWWGVSFSEWPRVLISETCWAAQHPRYTNPVIWLFFIYLGFWWWNNSGEDSLSGRLVGDLSAWDWILIWSFVLLITVHETTIVLNANRSWGLTWFVTDLMFVSWWHFFFLHFYLLHQHVITSCWVWFIEGLVHLRWRLLLAHEYILLFNCLVHHGWEETLVVDVGTYFTLDIRIHILTVI